MRLRLPAAGLAATVLALAPAHAAHARAQWLSGPSEESTVVSCSSAQAGTPVRVVGAAAFSEKRVDRRRPPRVGRVFRVRALIGAVGDPCVPQQAAVELVLPRGVRTAVGRRHRIECFAIDLASELRTRIARAQGCPRVPSRGRFGAALPRTGPQGPNWPLTLGQALEIQVPVRAGRPMRGRTRRTAGCDRPAGAPPCPRRLARNQLQFAIRVLDGNASPWLVPHLALTVRARERRRGARR